MSCDLFSIANVERRIIADLGIRKLPPTAAEDLLGIIIRHDERTNTILTSNRPIEDWGKLLVDAAAVTASGALIRPPGKLFPDCLERSVLRRSKWLAFEVMTEARGREPRCDRSGELGGRMRA